ncbi:hypothetical protein C8T65DRAFT_746074 [Cerioporus squamosus]|nr:hypothetical protein C8T65DRAFT_746074 [Cerioporus squamosus]
MSTSYIGRADAAAGNPGSRASCIRFPKSLPQYVFTLGLATSTAIEIIFTAILCDYLRQRKNGLDSVTTAVALICWVRKSDNLVFLGLHLAINKRECFHSFQKHGVW